MLVIIFIYSYLFIMAHSTIQYIKTLVNVIQVVKIATNVSCVNVQNPLCEKNCQKFKVTFKRSFEKSFRITPFLARVNCKVTHLTGARLCA